MAAEGRLKACSFRRPPQKTPDSNILMQPLDKVGNRI